MTTKEEALRHHWEKIYNEKRADEVSWTQEVPEASLEMISAAGASKQDSIIDIGGGDSKLVDFLLARGYENITVLDISGKAIERAKERLESKAENVSWMISDIREFKPSEQYDIWHDRAAFHFLTDKKDIEAYVGLVSEKVNKSLIMGTFSVNGPEKCSGLSITQYSEESMEALFGKYFSRQECKIHKHITPFDTEQEFVFCRFERTKPLWTESP